MTRRSTEDGPKASQLVLPGTQFPQSWNAQVPVAQGALTSLKGVAKERIADFVHGSDGFGNTDPEFSQVGGMGWGMVCDSSAGRGDRHLMSCVKPCGCVLHHVHQLQDSEAATPGQGFNLSCYLGNTIPH